MLWRHLQVQLIYWTPRKCVNSQAELFRAKPNFKVLSLARVRLDYSMSQAKPSLYRAKSWAACKFAISAVCLQHLSLSLSLRGTPIGINAGLPLCWVLANFDIHCVKALTIPIWWTKDPWGQGVRASALNQDFPTCYSNFWILALGLGLDLSKGRMKAKWTCLEIVAQFLIAQILNFFFIERPGRQAVLRVTWISTVWKKGHGVLKVSEIEFGVHDDVRCSALQATLYRICFHIECVFWVFSQFLLCCSPVFVKTFSTSV